MNIQVEDKPIIKLANNIRITLQDLTLGNTAAFLVFINYDYKEIDRQEIVLSPEEYQAWGNDDEYIVNLILTKLDMKQKSN